MAQTTFINLTLKLQKSRILQIQARPPAKQGEAAWGAKGAAVVIYPKPLTTQVEDPANSGEMRCRRLSHWVNNMAVFTIFMMPLGVNSIKAENKSENADHYSL